MSREELIEYIKKHDRNYNYDRVDFRYYSTEELEMIYERIQRQRRAKESEKGSKR